MASAAPRRSLDLVLLVGAVSVITGKSFSITNHCSYTVWPGISSGAGTAGSSSATVALESTGFELAPGQSRAMAVPTGWSGRVWGRTLCSISSTTGTTDDSRRFSCVTGDCGSGSQECLGGNAAPPVTLAQFTLDDGNDGGGVDSYDVSLVDGFNLPMVVAPAPTTQGQGNCAPTGCVADLNGACPAELRVVVTISGGATVACRSACQAFGSPEYCCTGAYRSPESVRAEPPNAQLPSSMPLPHTSGTTPPYTGVGGSQVGAVSGPWRTVVAVAVLGVVTAALTALAAPLGLFRHCCSRAPAEH